MPHITFSEKLAASARFAYIQCEGLYYHFFMLSDTFIYFARYVLLFASGSLLSMHRWRSTSFQLPTTMPTSSSVFIVLAASLCIGLALLTLDNDPYLLIAGQFISICGLDLTTSSHSYLSCLCIVVKHAEINKVSQP